MANYISKQSGDFTAVGSWANVAAGTNAYLIGDTANASTTTSYVWNTAFTVSTGQTIIGVMIKCHRITSGGTFSVALSDDNGTTATREVTVNASDINPIYPGWYFFKFGTTLASDGGTDYRVGVKSSSGGAIAVYRDATASNWVRALMINTSPGALAAADVFWCLGELTGAGTGNDFTITMNNTATTAWGNIHIGKRGIMTWGTSASTNYYLKLTGDLNVWNGGTLNMGTSGTPVPRNSTAVLEFNPAADGGYGLICWGGSTFSAQGLSRTSGKDIFECKLNTDEAVSQTVLGVDTDTGWLSGDEIGIAPTRRVTTQFEKRTLNGNASATEVTVSSGLSAAHDGTGNLQADVILLTRNVKIRSASATLMAYIAFKDTATIDMDWVEMYYLSDNAAGKRGIEITTITGGSCNIQYCSLHDFEDQGVYISGTTADNITFSNNVLYNINFAATSSLMAFSLSQATSGTSIVIDNNTLIGVSGTSANGFVLADVGGTFTNNTACGCVAAGFSINEGNQVGTMSGNKAYCNANGIILVAVINSTVSTMTALRNTSGGVLLQSLNNVVLNTINSYGNTTQNIIFSAGAPSYNVELNSITLKGESSYATANGVTLNINLTNIYFNNSLLGQTTGHTTADLVFATSGANNSQSYSIYLNNTSLLSTTEVSAFTTVVSRNYGNFICSSKHDATNATHKTWLFSGILEYTTSVPSGWTSPCLMMTPNTASYKLPSADLGVGMKCAVDSGGTVTVAVKIQKSASYNGNQPRLIVRRNDAAGITSDTVLDTATVGTATDETLTGTTASVTDDAVLEFIVDCDGTAGVVYVDDWAVS